MVMSDAEAAARFERGESVPVVSWAHRLLGGGVSLMFGVTLTSSLWTTGMDDFGWFFVSAGIAFCLLGVAGFRGAVMRFEPDHVAMRTTWRTRRVPRGEVVGFGTTVGSNAFGLPWRVPYVKPISGPVVTNDEIRSLRSGTVVDRSVAIGLLWLGEAAASEPPRRA